MNNDRQVVATLRRTLSQRDIDAYADVSGDRNPIHVDPVFAAASEFGRTIVHGQLLVGLVSIAVTQTWGDDWHEAGGLAVKFIAPVFVDDDVTVELSDRPASDEPGAEELEVHGRVDRRTVFAGTVHRPSRGE